MDFGKIPREKEWEGYEEDLDVKYAHKLFFENPEGTLLAIYLLR